MEGVGRAVEIVEKVQTGEEDEEELSVRGHEEVGVPQESDSSQPEQRPGGGR